MFGFKLIFIWGTKFNKIFEMTKELESLYYDLFVSSLVYKTKKEGLQKKREYYSSVKKHIDRINKEVRTFNFLIKEFDKYIKFDKLQEINLKIVKRIINDHKGEYLREEEEGIREYIMGTSKSASSFSRKNTVLLLKQTLLPLKQSIRDFVRSMENIYKPFGEFDTKVYIKKNTKIEIEKAVSCYSIGLIGEAVFIIGKILEKLTKDYLILLVKTKKINRKVKEIKEADFDKSINILRKERIISPTQYSKIMSVKWDRNIFGHSVRRKEAMQSLKDAEAMIKIGMNLIDFLEHKLNKK